MKLFFTTTILNILEREVVKKLLSQFLLTGKFKAWLTKFLVEYIFDHIVEPTVGYEYDKISGYIKLKKAQRAEERHDEQAYDDAVDSIFDS